MIVYTCSLGDTDPLPPAPTDSDASIAFVSRDDIEANGWTLIHVPESGNPRLACRKLKTRPHLLFPGRITLWIDAAYHLIAPLKAVEVFAGGNEFSALAHPTRKSCYEEAGRVILRKLSPPSAVKGMMARYQQDGFVSNGKLTCGGFLYRHPTPLVIRHSEIWWSQISECTWRDQLSIDWAAWKAGLTIHYLPGTPEGNVFAKHHSYSPEWRVQGRMPSHDALEIDWFPAVLRAVDDSRCIA